MNKLREPKWAVENSNEHGTVRLIETHQKAVAESVARKANEGFAAEGSATVSRVVPA